MSPEKMISVIGVNYLQPIATLIEARSSFQSEGPNEVQASRWDNGFSISLIILNVLLLESIINRVKYVVEENPSQKAIDFIKDTDWTKSFYENLLEIMVVRDVIAHNHIWEAEFDWDENFDMKLIEAHIIEGYGDKKFRAVVNHDTRKTIKLKLNLFPTRINWDDFLIVFKELMSFFMAVEKQNANKNANYFRISNEMVKFNKNIVVFKEVAKSLGVLLK